MIVTNFKDSVGNHLLFGDGAGGFVDNTDTNITMAVTRGGRTADKTLMAVLPDIDNDGDCDVFLANDYDNQDNNNRLFRVGGNDTYYDEILGNGIGRTALYTPNLPIQFGDVCTQKLELSTSLLCHR